MTKYKTSAAALVLSVALGIIAPLSASALTVDDLKAQIESLTAQLKTLQQQLHSQMASSTGEFMASSTAPRPMKCVVINRALGLGSQGSDVSDLQQQLAQDQDVYPQGSVTGYFGPATAAAVQKFQEKYGVASTSAPVVGPRMREFLKSHCNPGAMPGGMGSSTMPMMPRWFATSSSSTLPFPPHMDWMMATSSTSTRPMPPFGDGRPMFNASGTPPMPPRDGEGRPYMPPMPGATSTRN